MHNMRDFLQRNKLLELSSRQVRERLVQDCFVLLQRLNCLIRLGQNNRHVFERITEIALIQCDDIPALRNGHDQLAGLLRNPLRRPVAYAGL
ncbi:hypothetical protein D3C84_1183740 [compost metagenome]